MSSKVEATSELMDINNLKYEGPAKLTLVESGSVFKQNPADQNVYTSSSGTEMIINLQAGEDFVYGPNSYLRFDVKCDGATTADPAANNVGIGFLNTPATALFSRFLLEDKSGSEIERIEQLNRAVRATLPWKYPREYRNTCEMAGQPARESVELKQTTQDNFSLNQNENGGVTATGRFLRVCIPLWYFSGLFHEETLLPPQIISGMRFRLSLARAQEALQVIACGGEAVPAADDSKLTYTIDNPVIMLDTYRMGLSVQRNIQEQSQSEMGLPYSYQTLYYQSGNIGPATAYTQQVNKAVARAQKLWSQTQNADVADSVNTGNLGSAPLSYFQVQHRIGDWFAPNQLLQLGTEDKKADVQRNCSELYINNLQCSHADVCGMCMPSGIADPYHSPSISVNLFRKSTASGNGADAVICQTLNQSPHIGASGVAINNSRTCEVRLRYASNDGSNKQVQSWLEYVKVAYVYPSRLVVKQ
jgi:hypothetical protein